jgi:hypothetical protein
MAQHSPTIEGFRAAFRRPGVVVAEITWRWVFGATGLALLTLSCLEFLKTLLVSRTDLLFLRSNQPFLVAQALSHIFHGSARRVVISVVILSTALAVLWILSASVGRVTTLQSLLEYFHFNSEGRSSTRGRHGRFGSLVGLNFLRVALALAALLAIIAAGVISGFVSTDKNPQPGLAFLIFLPLAALVGLVWNSLNWFLSVAPIFVVGESYDTFTSIGAALDFCCERPGPVFWSSTAFGLIHLTLFAGASSVVAVPFAFVGVLPGSVVLAAVAVLTLIYFAAVDFFFTGRMAAYIAILQSPALPVGGVPVALSPVRPTVPASPPARPEWETLSDDILSDRGSQISTTAPVAGVFTGKRERSWEASEDDILSDVPGLILNDDSEEN